MKVAKLTGRDLRKCVIAATNNLLREKEAINALNVFPVPDGDTGTNMYLTMLAAAKELERTPSNVLSEVASVAARGSLMGARGNSGVILSQFFRGFAQGLEELDEVDARGLARAFQAASDTAYKAVIRPVEGTMLTVGRAASRAAERAVKDGVDDIVALCRICTEAARRALLDTPRQLAVLREAGVVDAGGQGLVTIGEGILAALQTTDEIKLLDGSRSPESPEGRDAAGKPAAAVVTGSNGQGNRSSAIAQVLSPSESRGAGITEKAIQFKYCTEFILVGENLSQDEIKRDLSGKGDSLLVVGDSRVLKIHVHTNDPGSVLSHCVGLGDMREIQINNMVEQNKEASAVALQLRAERDLQQTGENSSVADESLESGVPESPSKEPSSDEIGIVAVVPGDGFDEIFRSLGAVATVSGGQTMNPSTEDLAKAVSSVSGNNVIILPNNSNIIFAAQQVQHLTDKNLRLVPTKTLPQGISAMMAFNPEKDVENNVEVMTKSIRQITTGEITYAVRKSKTGEFEISENDIIGLIDGQIKAVGKSVEEILFELLAKMVNDDSGVITLYYGAGVEAGEVETIRAKLELLYPDCDVEVYYGGQPLYYYIISVE